jgi:hypothetical protein
MCVDLRDGTSVAGAKRVEQLFRLAFELIEIGSRAEHATRRDGGHDELLSWRNAP